MDIAKRIEFFQSIAIIEPVGNDEAMQIDVVDDGEQAIYVTGVDSGEQYYLPIDEIDMNEYVFYKLIIATPKSILGVESIWHSNNASCIIYTH